MKIQTFVVATPQTPADTAYQGVSGAALEECRLFKLLVRKLDRGITIPTKPSFAQKNLQPRSQLQQ
jgi:hypothetical protein